MDPFGQSGTQPPATLCSRLIFTPLAGVGVCFTNTGTYYSTYLGGLEWEHTTANLSVCDLTTGFTTGEETTLEFATFPWDATDFTFYTMTVTAELLIPMEQHHYKEEGNIMFVFVLFWFVFEVS